MNDWNDYIEKEERFGKLSDDYEEEFEPQCCPWKGGCDC